MITPVSESDTPINLPDGRYLVFSQVTSNEGNVLHNFLNVIDVLNMDKSDNMIETLRTSNDFWSEHLGYHITGIVPIKKD